MIAANELPLGVSLPASREPLPQRIAGLAIAGIPDAGRLAEDVGTALRWGTRDLVAMDRALTQLRELDVEQVDPPELRGLVAALVSEAIAALEARRPDVEALNRGARRGRSVIAERRESLLARCAAMLGVESDDVVQLVADHFARLSMSLGDSHGMAAAVRALEERLAVSAPLRARLVAVGVTSSEKWAVARQELARQRLRAMGMFRGNKAVEVAADFTRLLRALSGDYKPDGAGVEQSITTALAVKAKRKQTDE